MAEICFEQIGTPAFTLVPASSLKLYSFLRYTGLVVDFGASLTQISPVVNGYTSFKSSSSFKVSGEDIDNYMMLMLEEMNPMKDFSEALLRYNIDKHIKKDYDKFIEKGSFRTY